METFGHDTILQRHDLLFIEKWSSTKFNEQEN